MISKCSKNNAQLICMDTNSLVPGDFYEDITDE